MSGNGNVGTVKIILDGKEVEVPAGINLIEAAALHDKEVPHYCYHPKLTVAGNCRMCLVEMGAEGEVRVEAIPFSARRGGRVLTGRHSELLQVEPSDDFVKAILTDEAPVIDANLGEFDDIVKQIDETNVAAQSLTANS